MPVEESIVVFEGAGRDFDPAGAGWHRAVQAPVYRAGCGRSGQKSEGDDGLALPRRLRSSNSASRSWGTGISQAAISSSLAPTKHSSQQPSASPSPTRTGGPKTRQVIGRQAYTSQRPVAGSSAGQAASLANSSNLFLILRGSAQNAGFHIARKVGPVLVEPSLGSTLHLSSKGRIAGPQRIHAHPKPLGVQCVDCKSAMATLRAADPAGQPGARPACSVAQGRVHDLHEFGIPRGKGHLTQDRSSRFRLVEQVSPGCEAML